MDITVYLPDELGRQAKDAELNLSGLLRAAVTEELERREAVSNTLENTKEHILTVSDEEDRLYDARLVGQEIAYDERLEQTVYVTDDERVILYDSERQKYWQVDDPKDELKHLGPFAYTEALHALGLRPTVDI